MEYVYAALMLHKLKKDVTEENITSIVKASGVEVNEAQVKSLVASLADVNIEEAIKAAPVAAPAAAPAAASAEGGEGKKEDKKQDEAASAKSEEKAMEGLSSLFG
jgi:large subunit ribosomal protein L12